MWPINPNVLRARLDPERVKKAVIIVRNAVALVNGDIDLICSLHQIQRVDLEADLGVTSSTVLDPSLRHRCWYRSSKHRQH